MKKFGINQLFESLHCEDVKQNPFESKDGKELFERLYNATTEDVNIDKNYEIFEMIATLIAFERKHAFNVGYKTAFSLFLDGI